MRLVAVILVMSCAVGACFSSSKSDPSSYEGITWPGTKVGSGGPSSGPSVGNAGSNSEGNSSTSGQGPSTGNGGARYSTTVGQGGAGGPALHNDLPSGPPSESNGSSSGVSGSGSSSGGPGVCLIPANSNATAGCTSEPSQVVCGPDDDGGPPDCFSPCDDTEYQIECDVIDDGGTFSSPDPSLGCNPSPLGTGEMIYCCPCD
ncbi:MAG: hypothetical protein ACLP1X_17525 [Polyangiaceae bacterium]|jgi:hypothetical protein